MMNQKKTCRNIVLVGTYRPENEQWIRGRKMYNLPLPKCGKLMFHERIGGIVLFAEGRPAYAFRASFKAVVDSAELKKLGYRTSEVPHCGLGRAEFRHVTLVEFESECCDVLPVAA